MMISFVVAEKLAKEFSIFDDFVGFDELKERAVVDDEHVEGCVVRGLNFHSLRKTLSVKRNYIFTAGRLIFSRFLEDFSNYDEWRNI